MQPKNKLWLLEASPRQLRARVTNLERQCADLRRQNQSDRDEARNRALEEAAAKFDPTSGDWSNSIVRQTILGLREENSRNDVIQTERDRLAKLIEGFLRERTLVDERVVLAIAAKDVRRGRRLTASEQIENLCNAVEEHDRELAGNIRALRTDEPAREAEAPEPLTFIYRNHRGETAIRRARPISVRYGTTEWHPEPGWLLLAYDLDKQAKREFAMADMVTAPDARADEPARADGGRVAK